MPRLNSKAAAGRAFLDELLGESKSKGRKTCKEGKSCGSSCVSPRKSCAVAFPGKVSKNLDKLVDYVKTLNYNWTETATAAVLAGKDVSTKEKLEKAIKSLGLANSELYISNLYHGSNGSNPWSDKEYSKYISDLESALSPFTGKVDRVSVAGSTRNTPSIQNLDEGLNKKQIKSDVIFWVNGKPHGISVKDGPGAPLTNYTIEGGKNSDLKKLRLKLLEEAGFSKDWRKKVNSPEEKKKIRSKLNELFYDKESPYWKNMAQKIKENEKEILSDLINGMTARGVKYPMYETDGTKLKNLDEVYNRLTDPKNKVELKVIENPAKNPGPSAALHVGLFVNGEKEYDGKVRFKGNVFSPPEFLLKNKGYS
jgi:hypothetical protein